MITLTREEAQQVLDALETITSCSRPRSYYCSFAVEIETLRAKLSEPEPKPVAIVQQEAIGKGQVLWVTPASQVQDGTPLYTAPPQRKECLRCGKVNPAEIHTCTPQREWQGLTDEEMAAAWSQSKGDVLYRLKPFASAIEFKLKEKNT